MNKNGNFFIIENYQLKPVFIKTLKDDKNKNWKENLIESEKGEIYQVHKQKEKKNDPEAIFEKKDNRNEYVDFRFIPTN